MFLDLREKLNMLHDGIFTVNEFLFLAILTVLFVLLILLGREAAAKIRYNRAHRYNSVFFRRKKNRYSDRRINKKRP